MILKNWRTDSFDIVKPESVGERTRCLLLDHKVFRGYLNKTKNIIYNINSALLNTRANIDLNIKYTIIQSSKLIESIYYYKIEACWTHMCFILQRILKYLYILWVTYVLYLDTERTLLSSIMLACDTIIAIYYSSLVHLLFCVRTRHSLITAIKHLSLVHINIPFINSCVIMYKTLDMLISLTILHTAKELIRNAAK